MHAVLATDIVRMSRVREIIHLDIVLDAALDEVQTVLPDYGIIYDSLADKQFPLKVNGLVPRALFIGFVFGFNCFPVGTGFGLTAGKLFHNDFF